jgi:hypothetical protein
LGAVHLSTHMQIPFDCKANLYKFLSTSNAILHAIQAIQGKLCKITRHQSNTTAHKHTQAHSGSDAYRQVGTTLQPGNFPITW